MTWLVLFDIDGTLLWPKGCGREAIRLATEEVFGAAVDISRHAFGGKTDWQTLVELLAQQGDYGEAQVGAALPDFERAAARHLAQIIHRFPVQACPGAIEVVQALQDHPHALPGLLTGNMQATSPIKLQAAGFDPAWFKVGAYGSEAMDRNRLPFLARARAEQLLGAPVPPDRVIVIGDTPADVACARALGAVAVAVLTGYADRDELEACAPDYLLDDLTGFLARVPLAC